MLVDTHAHLDFPDFDPDRKEIIQKAAEAGVKHIINVSSDLRGCLASLDLIKKYENIFASIGIHPHSAAEVREEDFQRIPGLLKNEKVVAVGEVGLDYYRNLSPGHPAVGGAIAQATQDKQKDLFSRFIGLSLDSKLPLIIHSREAEADTINILKSRAAGLTVKGVVHCFSGSWDFCQECLDLGLYISFTCNVTYKKSEGLRELVKYVPADRLLLETDCPYLSPEGQRGKRNQPSNVRLLAQFIADLRGCSLEEIARNTSENAVRLFNLTVRK